MFSLAAFKDFLETPIFHIQTFVGVPYASVPCSGMFQHDFQEDFCFQKCILSWLQCLSMEIQVSLKIFGQLEFDQHEEVSFSSPEDLSDLNLQYHRTTRDHAFPEVAAVGLGLTGYGMDFSTISSRLR